VPSIPPPPPLGAVPLPPPPPAQIAPPPPPPALIEQPWQLVVEGGPTLRLAGSRVVLGRRPAGAGDGAQELAIHDPTRTLSKVHARLDLADGVWTVTDLNATNGVIVIGADGSENLLDPGASAPVVERLMLGKVAMRVTSEVGEATL
jgi:hypothetical protein